MPQSLSMPLLTAHARFDDVEHATSAIADWDVEFFQLSKGSLHSELTILAHQNFVIQKVSFDKPVFQRGASPQGMTTFGFTPATAQNIRWGSQEGKADDLMLFSPKGWDTVSPENFTGHTLSFDDGLIEQIAHSLGEESIPIDQVSTSSLASNSLSHIGSVRLQLAQILDSIEAGRELPDTESFLHFLNFELPAQLIMAGNIAHQRRKQAMPKNREQVRIRCLDIIMATEAKALTVQSLCLQAGTTLSTVERVFKFYFGIGPKQYINIVRLHRLHRALLFSSREGGLINAIASQFGFWHMGQLSRDYFNLFGVLPSQTLDAVYTS